ncbi:expressed unknown protein [Seminavis robusta]|uniref:Uncharacterized protein n=1 Tax=Seminavis robusta TaxID=568900 RepID=A0A9N8EGG7_9STRA|nr:expressed unknown protein [Seminavis robusta]|eukprot:Sro965_g225520.1 n/a (218) ;mRNA; r:3737-4390
MVRKSKKGLSMATLACKSKHSRSEPLFQAILKCAWTDIRHYFISGTWKSDDYEDSTSPAYLQARKESTYLDSFSRERVRQLPLHAAISHLAPLSIVVDIVRLYPEAVNIRDSKGHLPLHLAVLTNAEDVAMYLLKVSPDAFEEARDPAVLMECDHDSFRSLEQEQLFPKVDRSEMKQLELRVARDARRMAEAQEELQDLMDSFRMIRSSNGRELGFC